MGSIHGDSVRVSQHACSARSTASPTCSSVMAMPPSEVAPWQLMSYVAEVRATDGSVTPAAGSMLWSNDSCGSSGVCASRAASDGTARGCHVRRAQRAVRCLTHRLVAMRQRSSCSACQQGIRRASVCALHPCVCDPLSQVQPQVRESAQHIMQAAQPVYLPVEACCVRASGSRVGVCAAPHLRVMVVRVRSVAASHEAPDVAAAPLAPVHHAGEGGAVLREVLRRARAGRCELAQVLRHAVHAPCPHMVVVPRKMLLLLGLRGKTFRADHGGRGRAVTRHRCSMSRSAQDRKRLWYTRLRYGWKERSRWGRAAKHSQLQSELFHGPLASILRCDRTSLRRADP